MKINFRHYQSACEFQRLKCKQAGNEVYFLEDFGVILENLVYVVKYSTDVTFVMLHRVTTIWHLTDIWGMFFLTCIDECYWYH